MACPDWSGERSNMLILTGSTKSLTGLEQMTGRVFRAAFPTIIDMVDNNKICKRHWTERKKWYEDEGRNAEIIFIEMKKDENNSLIDPELTSEQMNNDQVKTIHQASLTRAKLRLVGN